MKVSLSSQASLLRTMVERDVARHLGGSPAHTDLARQQLAAVQATIAWLEASEATIKRAMRAVPAIAAAFDGVADIDIIELHGQAALDAIAACRPPAQRKDAA